MTDIDITPARELADLAGEDKARTAIEAGWRAIRELNSGSPQPLVHPGVADYVATVAILAAVEAGLADPGAKVDELTADLAKSRAQAATYANEIGSLKAELERVNAAFGDARAELSERYAERDGLRTELVAQRDVIAAVKKWRESDDVQAVGLDVEGMELVDAYDAYEIDRTEAEVAR